MIADDTLCSELRAMTMRMMQDVYSLWSKERLDTMTIAERLHMPEALVYSLLSRRNSILVPASLYESQSSSALVPHPEGPEPGACSSAPGSPIPPARCDGIHNPNHAA